MHAQPLGGPGHVAVALLVDTHDVLPTNAMQAQGGLRHGGQRWGPVEQGVDQLVLIHRLGDEPVGTGTQRQDNGGKSPILSVG